MRKYLVDTNVILESPEILADIKYVMSSHVLREIEKHEHSHDQKLSFQARQVKRFLNLNNDITYDLKDYRFTLNDIFDGYYEDNRMLQACVENGYGLVTNDILLKMKAEGFGIEVIVPSEKLIESSYCGYKEVILSEIELAEFYENTNKNKYKLFINEYLIIKNEANQVIDKFRWNGSECVKLKHASSKKIKSMNILQDCAIDLLLNESIPIKILAGNYGSGKSILSVKAALYHVLEKGNFSKIMMVRNPIGSGEEIGFLKGTKDDKTKDFFKPFIQHLDGGEQEAYFLEQRGVLTKEIPYYMKGLSIEDTVILCDEAEDLDVKLIKLIGTRLAKNSAVIFSGDYKQVEDEYKRNNGLLTAIEKLKGNPLVGIVVLKEDVRSDASKVFADLD